MTKTKRLTESAMLIAIAVVLELVGKSIIPPMPFGGQVTLVSMLPMVLLTLLTTPLMYHFVRLIHGHYRRKLSD